MTFKGQNINRIRVKLLTFKAPITTAADDKLDDIFFNFWKKIRHDISCESSAGRHTLLSRDLLADDSHGILGRFCYFEKVTKLKMSFAANNSWRFMS